MRQLPPRLRATLVLIACCVLGACGGAEEDFAAESGFDESQLPADFPRNLVPPSYETANYMQFGQVETASFESRAPLQETIEHYTSLLGEPTLSVDGDDGEGSVQWQISPWLVSIVGGGGESIIGVTRTPE